MKLQASGEDYLEAVLMLQQRHGMVRSVDLARHMGYSKPSISHAVGVLRGGGFLTVDQDGVSSQEKWAKFRHKVYQCRGEVSPGSIPAEKVS